MVDDEFLKERANIRAKMLKYSRAVNEGKSTDEILASDEVAESNNGDDVLKKRLEKDKKDAKSIFATEKEKLTLKKDLIDVKLEEKISFFKRFFAFFKKNTTAPKANTIKARQTPEKKQSKIVAHQAKPMNSTSKEDRPSNNKAASTPTKIQEKPLKQSPQIQSIKITEEDNVEAKNVLLQGHSKATQDEKNLGANQLLFAALCIVFAVVVFAPKVYITSNIYYLSRDIAALRTQESVLSEENKELNKKLENMRFQNQILDYLE